MNLSLDVLDYFLRLLESGVEKGEAVSKAQSFMDRRYYDKMTANDYWHTLDIITRITNR